MDTSPGRENIYLSGAKRIPLTKGQFAIVDAADFGRVNQYKWHYNSHGYAYRYAGGGRKNTKRQSMHEFIYGKPECLIDHRDGSGLNNRRDNLRAADKSLNAANSKTRSDNTSGYRCVYESKEGNFYSQITVRGKTFNLGTFVNKKLAALAYNEAAKENFGEFARLNDV